MVNDDILVTVVCITYNHEKYIRDALDGFVNQKTDFNFEVIVHDDASTDKTRDIIEEYRCKYPQIIKPIYEETNLYSQGIPISKAVIWPLIKGKYVASCEGDDYWCDVTKLQKQIDFLENNPDYIACTHNTLMIDCRTNSRKVRYDSKNSKELKLCDVVVAGGKCYHTSSLIQRKEFYLLPDELRANGFGDYNKSMYLALNGRIYYMKDVMSVYRFFTAGSWSSRTYTNNKKFYDNVVEQIRILNAFNQYSRYEHNEIFLKAILSRTLIQKTLEKRYEEIIKDDLLKKEYQKTYGTFKLICLYIRVCLPVLDKIYCKLFNSNRL